MTRALACAIVSFALTGCGTVQNFVDFPEDTGERTKPYGGVKIAAKGIRESHDVELTYTWPFRLADVALSAVGDTLTLPITLPLAAVHAVHDSIRDYYFPDRNTKTNQPSETSVANQSNQSTQVSTERRP